MEKYIATLKMKTNKTYVEKRFKVRDAYKVFTEELGIDDARAERLVYRDYWELLEYMKEVARGNFEPPAFVNVSYLEEFLDRCNDVNTCYIYKFDAYKGTVCMDTDDGGNIELWLGDIINEDLLKNPKDADKWMPWRRMDLKSIDIIITECSMECIENVDIEMYDFSSDGEVVLKYELK